MHTLRTSEDRQDRSKEHDSARSQWVHFGEQRWVSFCERQGELSREGFTVVMLDYVRSFDGPLRTVAFTPVVLPVTGDLNEDFSASEHVNLAGKLYLLYRDTDIDVTFLADGSRTGRIGVDFSRNLTPDFEIHGELAYIHDQPRVTIGPANQLQQSNEDAVLGLLGLRYLTRSEVTWILEYLRNGGGYNEQELETFYRLGGSDPATAPDLYALARQARSSGYAAPNPGTDYLYVRATRKEPFDVVYLTAGFTTIVNLRDRSASLTPELTYTGIENTEARLRLTWLHGGQDTEYGEKLSDRRLEIRLRYFF